MNSLSPLQLRKFGITMAFAFFGVFGLLFPYLFQKSYAMWPFVLALLFFIPSLLCPNVLKYIYTPWMKIGHVLGWINTRLILGIIFFALITPFGIIMRMMGKDPMARAYDKNSLTYRKMTPPQPIKHMERPF